MLVATSGALAAAEAPPYLRSALRQFSPGVPAGWAYTLATDRDSRTLLERFDPSHPAGHQWSLLEYLGRAPTAAEQEKYASSRPTAEAGGQKANFSREDIEPGSLQLVSEDSEQAEFLGGFRSSASGADKMLAHLRIRLFVRKATPYVQRYVLELADPYWPVLGVKMNTLVVDATFAPPAADRPSLPEMQTSTFAGRILFVPTAENIRLAYRDFQLVSPELSR